MDPTTPLLVSARGTGEPALKELVIAWAHDAYTGEAKYIMELGPERAGGNCDCICPSCQQPLTGVNVAKTHYKRRPHFRHQKGSARLDCAIVAARAALLRGLENQGFIDLPDRRYQVNARGLSGADYCGVSVRPAERVSIQRVNYVDRVRAVLTLGDGRQLDVILTGTHEATINGEYGASAFPPSRALIELQVDDPEVCCMDPDEIRKHLTLNSGVICWRTHWEDDALKLQALGEVERDIQDHLDAPPDGLDLPEDMPPELKRETVLHFVVKDLLRETGQIWTPPILINPQVRTADGAWISRKWTLPAERHVLSNIVLERRLGLLRPDLICDSVVMGGYGHSPFLIEVAVTSHVKGERRAKIKEMNFACLEIDISRLAGRVTREQLKDLVVQEFSFKTWVHHPVAAEITAKFAEEMNREGMRIAELEGMRLEQVRELAVARGAPLSTLAHSYLAAVKRLLHAQTEQMTQHGARVALDDQVVALKRAVKVQADLLAECGISGAGEPSFFGWEGMLARLLSMQSDRAIGVRQQDGFHVLNAALDFDGLRKPEAILMVAAAKAFKISLNEEQRIRYQAWRQHIALAFGDNALHYQRDTRHDRLLSILFPELREALYNTSPTGLAPFAARRAAGLR